MVILDFWRYLEKLMVFYVPNHWSTFPVVMTIYVNVALTLTCPFYAQLTFCASAMLVEMQRIFSDFDIPEVILLDSGFQLDCAEFLEICN